MPFTLQSCSKPLTYAIALDRLSQEVVHQYVGQEPSGRNFNELVLDYNSECCPIKRRDYLRYPKCFFSPVYLVRKVFNTDLSNIEFSIP